MQRITINLSEVVASNFKGGELNINIERYDIKSESFVSVYAVLRSARHLMKLILVVDAINEINPQEILVYIPYLPYGRQDVVFNKGEALSLRVIGKLLNTMVVDRIFVLDMHSEKTYAWIKNLENIPQEKVMPVKRNTDVLLICPDEGAIKRATDMAKKWGSEIAYFKKVRDPVTRRILSLETNYEVSKIKGMPCIISDDICDGGRTFMSIAALLKSYGAKSVYLYVSHGIFSYGFKQLYESGIDKITTGNHMISVEYIGESVSYEKQGKLMLCNTKKEMMK